MVEGGVLRDPRMEWDRPRIDKVLLRYPVVVRRAEERLRGAKE
jgi:hypothetical protein